MGKLLGLTGLYCAGKNHVAALLEQRGLPVLDLDRLGYEALDSRREPIVRRFGPEVLDSGGLVDRRRLGRLVFGRPGEMAALEALVHPEVNRLTEAWIARQSASFSVINAALLHRSSVWGRLDALAVVYAPFPVRFCRAARRDALSLGEIFRRFRSQAGFPFGRRKKNAPEAQLFSAPSDMYTIVNSGFPGSEKSLERRIDGIVSKLAAL